MIVTDANVIACFAIRDDRSALADAAFAMDSEWVAPLLWRSEFRGTLTKYLWFAGMSMEAALMALHSAEEAVGGREYAVSPEAVLELAVQSRCTAYDCEYVALARELDVPLVTIDKQILRAFPKVAVSLETFVKAK